MDDQPDGKDLGLTIVIILVLFAFMVYVLGVFKWNW